MDIPDAVSRYPRTSLTVDEMEELLVAARKARPTWGTQKLRARLVHYRPQLRAATTKHDGSRSPSQRAHHATPAPGASHQSHDAALCRPHRPERDLVRRLQRALPHSTKLAVWCLRLGIRLERIEPGKPEQNGRQKRFRRTLKHENPSSASRHPHSSAALVSTCLAESTTTSGPMKHSRNALLPVPSLFRLAAVRAHYCASQSMRPGISRRCRAPLRTAIEQWHVVFGPPSLRWIRQPPGSALRQLRAGWLIGWRRSSLRTGCLVRQ